MGRYVTAETKSRVSGLMSQNASGAEAEAFLTRELERYIPQMAGWSEEAVERFMAYQRAIYLSGETPEVGRVIASLNPSFVDSVAAMIMSRPDGVIYTRASVKENGYRMQLHVGPVGVSAFTRQFTRYDLRMFPELAELFDKLPVMIGDAELINKPYRHLAGFNRVQLRIPNQTYWPKGGESGLPEEFLERYLSDPKFFVNGKALPETEMTLAFHGMFAIADPSTWNKSRKTQMKNLIPLCQLPVDYRRIDEILDQLETFLKKKKLNARVVERVVVNDIDVLKAYITKNDEGGFEGTCVVQTSWNASGVPEIGARGIKIKSYESMDCALLGLYLADVPLGLTEGNLSAALVGLYDQALGVYLPAAKVNLDPNGVQIKTEGQRERLIALRKELAALAAEKAKPDQRVYTLYDTFLLEGKLVLKYLFKDRDTEALGFEKVLEEMPTRSDIIGLFEAFSAERDAFIGGTVKATTVPKKFIALHLDFFRAIDVLDENGRKRFLSYFSRVKDIKATSSKFVRPQIAIDTEEPVILETLVFDIKFGASPYSAGFHSWYGDSFRFNNAFAERVRHDKKTTTDYGTVHTLARMYTPKTKK